MASAVADIPKAEDLVDPSIVEIVWIDYVPVGKATLIYDTATGNVKIDASRTKSGRIISFAVSTRQNNMRTKNFVENAPYTRQCRLTNRSTVSTAGAFVCFFVAISPAFW